MAATYPAPPSRPRPESRRPDLVHTRDDRHRSELAHRARVGEDDAVEHRPADVGQRHVPEHLVVGRWRGGTHDMVGQITWHMAT